MKTILLVEEDPLQASARMSVLKQRFPDVRRVANSTEALCLIEQPAFSGNLGLIICGHRLPGFGGPAFVTELHTRLPGLQVLVLGDALESRGDYVGEAVRFLAKPAAADAMLAAASQMLSESERKVD